MDPETRSRHHRRLTSGKGTWSARCGESRTPGAGGGLRETTGGNTGTAPASLPHHLPADPAARYTGLGPGYYQARTGKDKKIKNHIRQIEALLGHPITITPKAA
jgi:hypothetical protein